MVNQLLRVFAQHVAQRCSELGRRNPDNNIKYNIEAGYFQLKDIQPFYALHDLDFCCVARQNTSLLPTQLKATVMECLLQMASYPACR